jgi:DNA-binding MarR family transcriptional regulator
VDSFEPALVEAVEALRELILAGEHYRQNVTAYLNLDMSQTQALSYLYSRGDMGQSELGALLGFNTSTMTALVDRLERADIAQRRPHPTDRRRSVVHLTDSGRQAIRTTGRWFVRAFDHVDPTQLPDLTVAFTAIAADLRTHGLHMTTTPTIDA